MSWHTLSLTHIQTHKHTHTHTSIIGALVQHWVIKPLLLALLSSLASLQGLQDCKWRSHPYSVQYFAENILNVWIPIHHTVPSEGHVSHREPCPAARGARSLATDGRVHSEPWSPHPKVSETENTDGQTTSWYWQRCACQLSLQTFCNCNEKIWCCFECRISLYQNDLM